MNDPTPAIDASLVADNIAAVRERIARAGGADRVRLVAVTKGFGVDAVEAALAAGVSDIGENYSQELEQKASALGDASGVRWHMIGRVQRNKVRRVANLVHLWQSVDRVEVGAEIAARSPGAGVLVQVNTAGETQKAGCDARDAPALVGALRALALDVHGLMTIGPAGDPDRTRAAFRRLSVLAAELGVRELSMGMSDDLDIAVDEGATMVRIGRGLFGERSSRG
jgi:PLP dependent protein